MRAPKVGDKVEFFVNGRLDQRMHEQGFVSLNDRAPCHAVVAHVHDERTVNLSVTGHNGMIAGAERVVLVQAGDQVPGDMFCQWPEPKNGDKVPVGPKPKSKDR